MVYKIAAKVIIKPEMLSLYLAFLKDGYGIITVFETLSIKMIARSIIDVTGYHLSCAGG